LPAECRVGVGLSSQGYYWILYRYIYPWVIQQQQLNALNANKSENTNTKILLSCME